MAECGLDFQETYRGFRLPVAYACYSSRLRIRYRRTKQLAFPPVAGNGGFSPGAILPLSSDFHDGIAVVIPDARSLRKDGREEPWEFAPSSTPRVDLWWRRPWRAIPMGVVRESWALLMGAFQRLSNIDWAARNLRSSSVSSAKLLMAASARVMMLTARERLS